MYITFFYLCSSPKTSINSKWMNFCMEFYAKGTKIPEIYQIFVLDVAPILVCLGKIGFT